MKLTLAMLVLASLPALAGPNPFQVSNRAEEILLANLDRLTYEEEGQTLALVDKIDPLLALVDAGTAEAESACKRASTGSHYNCSHHITMLADRQDRTVVNYRLVRGADGWPTEFVDTMVTISKPIPK